MATVRGHRLFLALALTMVLHAGILVSVRPTLVGGASNTVVQPMSVRLLALTQPTPATSPGELAESGASRAFDSGVMSSSPAPRQGALSRRYTDSNAERKASASIAAQEAGDTAAVSRLSDKVPAVPATGETGAQGLEPAPAYLPSGKLDPGPRPLQDIEPVYPDEGNLRQGSVVLRLLINEAGEVDNVAVVRAYPKGAFEDSAIAAFAVARFSPGMLLGVAVKSQLTIEVEFMPINRGARVSGRGY